MSFLQLHLPKISLHALSSRLFGTGAQNAVMTHVVETKASAFTGELSEIGWDLIHQEHRVRASGAKILHVFGEVLSFDGLPVTGATVEIRQCDMYGRAVDEQRACSGFYGVGRTTTDFEGRYQFRTILPAPARTQSAGIDALVIPPHGRKLATRLYFLNHAANDQDWEYQALGPARQAAVTLDPVRRPDGDLDAGFNFVL